MVVAMRRMRPSVAVLVAGVILLATVATVATVAVVPGRPAQADPGPEAGVSASALAAGDAFGCAITAARQVRCWGANASGQLGDGTTTDAPAGVTVSGLTGVVAVTAAGSTACAIDGAGAAWCWGAGTSGQLGNGASTSSSVPVAVSGLSAVTSLAIGPSHGCAVAAGGRDQDGQRAAHDRLQVGGEAHGPMPEG